MSQGRLLIAGLLSVLAVVVQDCARSATPTEKRASATSVESDAPPAKNAISGFTVTKDKSDQLQADFDYAYTGTPATAIIGLDLVGQSISDPNRSSRTALGMVKPHVGTHHYSFPIEIPDDTQVLSYSISMYETHVRGAMVVDRLSAPVRQVVEVPRNPNDKFDPRDPDGAVRQAAMYIDSGWNSSLTEARHILERVIESNPKVAQAYVELARVAMKSNWSDDGRHQAENLLDSALQIEPTSVNAKILLGYVYAHQKRYPRALSLFQQAEQAGTRNNWLWANWGELLIMEGKPDQAILKYREVLQHPASPGTWDRARLDAYAHLIPLLRDRKDLDGMEVLYRQRVQDFGPGSCYSAEYSSFLLNVRGDPQAAIDLSRRALKQNCDDTESRAILGLASYVKWATTEASTSAEALNQARIYMPAGPPAFYRLASSDKTVAALGKLLSTGESLDSKDNDGQTALAYAVEKHDAAAIKRLLNLGAHADIAVGFGDIPLALQPVMEGDLDAVRMLRQAGVDYSRIRYQGATAFDYAERTRDNELAAALGARNRSL